MTNEKLTERKKFLDDAAIQIAASLTITRGERYAEGYDAQIAEHAYSIAAELLDIRDQITIDDDEDEHRVA